MVWERRGEAYYATVVGADGEPLYHLIVGELPEGMWDCAVWSPGGDPALVVRGVARTVQEAMREAEKAAD